MAAAMAVKEFTIASGSTAAVNIDLTGKWSDSGSHTPVAYLIFYHNGSAGTTMSSNLWYGRGMSDGTTHYSYGVANADSASSATGKCWVSNAAPLVEVDTAAALTGVVNHTSFAADTITITPSDALANSIAGFVIAFYDTVGAKVHDLAGPGAMGNYSVTGTGLRGKAAIFLGQALGTTINAGGNYSVSMGFATSSSEQACLMARERNGQTSDYSLGEIISTGVHAFIEAPTGTAQSNEIRFVSFDADGFTANRVSGTNAFRYGVLILGSDAKVVTSAQRTAIETWDVTVTGLTPYGVLALAENPQTAVQTVSSEGMHNAIGAATANGQCSLELSSYANDTLGANLTEQYVRSETAKLLTHYDRTGADTFTKVADVEKSAFSDETLTLSQTDANTAAVYMALLVFGDTFAGGGGSTIPVLMNQYRHRRASL